MVYNSMLGLYIIDSATETLESWKYHIDYFNLCVEKHAPQLRE